MAKERLSMRKIKEVLRLKWGKNLSNRQVARSCSISRATVGEYLTRAKEAGLSWPLPDDLDDGAVENLLFPDIQKQRLAGCQCLQWRIIIRIIEFPLKRFLYQGCPILLS